VVPDPSAACTALDETRTAGLWLVRAVADLAAVPCAAFAVWPEVPAELPFPGPALILGWPVLETVVTG
jgi:hypothetical protein